MIVSSNESRKDSAMSARRGTETRVREEEQEAGAGKNTAALHGQGYSRIFTHQVMGNMQCMHSPNIGPVYRQNLHISHVKVCIYCKDWTQLNWTYLLSAVAASFFSPTLTSGLMLNLQIQITWPGTRSEARLGQTLKLKHFTFCNGKYLRVFKKHHLEQIRLKAAFMLEPKMILGVRKVTFLLVAGRRAV